MHFPKGSRYLKITLNEKKESQVLDLLLDGNDPTPININDVAIPANELEITQLTFSTSIAFVVISPRLTHIESTSVNNNIKLTNDLIKDVTNADN